MAASIAFTDGTGAATLTAVGGVTRFGNWTPRTRPVGERVTIAATGRLSVYTFRTDQVASFEFGPIAAANLDIALRLQAHLLGGGVCTVTTGDLGARTYTAALDPGTEPEIAVADRGTLEYVLTVSLLNTGSSSPMLCVYA